ncbi:LPD7 domain-containing protein [Pseudomonas aeruginosa]|uniref:LPD7 domain-containing protein n=1 Tax=Pseudomonas aeruginosa TaxID=287 RepID=UPI00106CCCDF|nr:LPD7 domain-containing protein [Pseudomonas aeruginosa]
MNRNTWSVAEAAQPELAKVAEAGGELAGQAMVVGVDLDATELSLTRLQVQGLDAAPGAEPDARTKEEKRKRLFDEAFWEDCKSIYLAPAEKGGLRTDIQITETTVKFILGKLGQIDLDTRDNTIGVRGRLDPVQAAMAMIELAQKAGWKTLSFHGDKRFMDVAIPLAEKAGFTVVDQATMAEMLRVRSDEKKAEKGDEIPFDQGPTP